MLVRLARQKVFHQLTFGPEHRENLGGDDAERSPFFFFSMHFLMLKTAGKATHAEKTRLVQLWEFTQPFWFVTHVNQ